MSNAKQNAHPVYMATIVKMYADVTIIHRAMPKPVNVFAIEDGPESIVHNLVQPDIMAWVAKKSARLSFTAIKHVIM